MPVILGGQPGRVTVLQDPAAPMSASAVSADGFGGFDSMRSVITRAMVSRQGNFQFMHTFGDSIHLYVFGERIGQIVLSGISFSGSCSGFGGELGIERVLEYYDANRVASREDPVRVTIGLGSTFNSYLIGMTGALMDPETRLYQFDMHLTLIPQKRR